MGINFNAMGGAPASAPIASENPAATMQQVPTANGGLTLDLSKGAVLDLTKAAPGLDKCTLGAGWSVAAAGSPSIDLDISAFLLNENGRITAVSDVIFFNNMEAAGIKKDKDDTTGGSSEEGDDEKIFLKLSEIPQKYQSIAVVVNIFDAMTKHQTFGMVKDAYVRLIDDSNGNEVLRFRLTSEAASSTAVYFCKLYRNANGWSFEAVQEGMMAKDLNDVLARFS